MVKKIIVDCCRHCPFVDCLDGLCSAELQECRPYCTQPGLFKENPDIEDVDKIPDWCKLEEDKDRAEHIRELAKAIVKEMMETEIYF